VRVKDVIEPSLIPPITILRFLGDSRDDLHPDATDLAWTV